MADENQVQTQNPAEAFQNILNKNNGDALKLASQLFDENFAHRTKIRELQKAQPKDGTVFLEGDEAKQFNEYKQLLNDSGLDLSGIKERVGKFSELETSNKQLAQMDTLREVAEINGYKVSVLKKLMTDYPDADIQIKTVKDKDSKQDAKAAFIALDGKESSFEQFVDDNKLADIYSLKAAEDKPLTHGNPPNPPEARSTDSLFDRIRKDAEAKKQAAPNPASWREIAGRLI